MKKYMDETGVKYMWQKTKAYVEQEVNEIKGDIVSVYRPKGTIGTLAELKALPEDNLEVGDVYNVKESGMNYLWTGDKENPDYDEGWVALGGIIEIPTLTIEDIDRLLSED